MELTYPIFVLIIAVCCCRAGFIVAYLVDEDSELYQDKFVFSDSCLDKAPNFCHLKVENSVCNQEKNECFCKRGFVVIKERNKIICKPLLTDLPCRVDKDCIHVSGSMCHPGAGQCVCPSRHVFVPQLFLCRKKYELASSEAGLCKICRENNGECFLYDPKDTRIFGYKTRETVGCSCGGNRALMAMESPTATNICSAKLVDIGAICNDRDLICISLKAVCTKIMNFIDKCQCMENHVPVYQTMLRYYECFPIFEEKAAPIQCSKCQNAGGKCYDTTNSNKPDGCACPGSLSNVENGPPSLMNPCTMNHFSTDFQGDKLKICFQPYSFPPFETLKLQLQAKRAAVFISHPQSQSYATSHLTANRKKIQIQPQIVNDKKYFCGIVEVHDKSQIIRVKQIQTNRIQYEGIFEIVRDEMKQDSVVDIAFPFKTEREGNILDHISPIHENSTVRVEESLQLELRVLDATKNREIVKIGTNNPVVLDVTLIDSTGFFTDLAIENCFLSNFSSSDILSTTMQTSYVFQRCSNSSKQMFIVWKQISPGIHYQTNPIFLSQPISWHGDIYIHCQISLCSSQESCQLKDCNQRHQNDPPTRSLYRHTKIALVDKVEESLEKIYGIKDNYCSYSLCLNQLQAIMTSVLLLLLLLLVVILLLILFKRQRMLQKFSIAKMNVPSTVNSYKASSDFMNGNNQNFYLLTDNNSVTNSTDNFDSYDTSLPPLRDSTLSGSFHLRTDNNPYPYPHYHRSSPFYDTNPILITSFPSSIPCQKISVSDLNTIHTPEVSHRNDNSISPEMLQKTNNNLEPQKTNGKNTNLRCSEMICMCNE